MQEFNTNTVVFDEYNKSTEDATHKTRSDKISQTVEIIKLMEMPAPQIEQIF